MSLIENLDLEFYKDRNRILMLFAPGQDELVYQKQWAKFHGYLDDLADRDMLVFHLFNRENSFIGSSSVHPRIAKKLREQFKVSHKAFQVLLLDKGGNELMRSDEIVTPAEVFAAVDGVAAKS